MEAINTMTYILNQIFTIAMEWATPLEAYTGKTLSATYLYVIGSTCWVHVLTKFGIKLEAESNRYSLDASLYLSPTDYDLTGRKIVFSREVDFDEWPHSIDRISETIETNISNKPAKGGTNMRDGIRRCQSAPGPGIMFPLVHNKNHLKTKERFSF